MYFPNRDELSLRVVFALPKASRMGFVARIWRSISLESSRENLAFVLAPDPGGFTEARYRMINFAFRRSIDTMKGFESNGSYRFSFSRTTDSILDKCDNAEGEVVYLSPETIIV
jgi:hypothetical protein